jgi:putative metalloprotease
LTDLPFNVKEDKTPNAWVTNGKSVTVTTKLLEILDTDQELFGVLAHESGHVKLGHYGKTVNRHVGLSVAAKVLGNLLGGGLGSAAVGVGANLAAAGWSREQEVEADDYAVKLAYKTGEDPVGLYSALVKLSDYGGELEPSGFNSHPPDARRLLHIRQEIMKYDPDAKFPARKKKPASSDAKD